ncbi:hypothetical protein [Streptomyces sp. NPDC051569]|uniref:hypothetical protein n=1 Tax=Streptomyces sp. NPDC051569 TaxID=3365661 RepID=UPI00379C4CA9
MPVSASGQFEVETPVLRAEGANFSTIGQEFGNALTRLSTGLSALEGSGTPPWGDDDLGEKFGVVYEGFRDGMRESMGSLADRLGGMGAALTEMGARHEANEESTEVLMKDRESDVRTDEGRSRFLGGT